jgi:alanine-synthesizing transaminase
MFSDRLPRDLAANRLTHAVDALRAEGRAFIDLTESNPTRACFSYPADLLSPLGNAGALVYCPSPFGDESARGAVANDYRRQGLSVASDRIVLTASSSDAYSLLFKLLADAGDEVLVPRPSYPLFDHLTRLDLVTPRPYDLEYHGAWSIDIPSVESAVTPRTRAMLIVSPNNPTGSYVSKPELERLSAFCAARDIAIIADEVFADYELEPGAAARAGRAPAAGAAGALTFALGGLSKSIGLPQAKLGWIAITGPETPVANALERLAIICDTYLSVSTPVQLAAAELLDRGVGVRAQIAERVSSNYRRLGALAAAAPACTALRSDGGWYGVLQVPSVEPEEQLALRLLAEEGVLAHPGYFFDFEHGSFLVVSLLTPDDVFVEGVERILRRLG